MQLVILVVDGGWIASALVRYDVNHARGLEASGSSKQVLQRLEVVAVCRAGVLEAEAVEDRTGLEELLERLLDPEGRLIGLRADEGEMAEAVGNLFLEAFVARVDLELGEVSRQPANGGRVRAPVVVEHDHEVGRLKVGDLVERLISHSASESAIADHGHDVTGDATAQTCLGDAKRVGEGGRGVAVFDHVVRALRSRWIAGKAARLPQRGKGAGTAGEQLVHVRLMAGVPDDHLVGALEDAVQCERKLDDAQIRRQVAAGLRDVLDEERSDLRSQLLELATIQGAQVRGRVDRLEHYQLA